ncbi:MAG: hypothetical protein CMJ40_02355 [Phycisphaerae bacterium]|nr:hypothetical protein [Phycisphaerae bacterium]|tara:strand:+ start:2048 stop:2482 length:435 start_codon:yes stop_codon:yes gene_type:complete
MSICLLTMMLACLTVACKSSHEAAVGKTIEPLPGSDAVRIPGPSSLRSDGSVRNRRMNRPDGRLLKTATATDLRFHQVEPWARNELVMAASNAGLAPEGVEGWIRIEGPRMLPISKQVEAEVYDVQLEIWKCAAEPRKREREVE